MNPRFGLPVLGSACLLVSSLFAGDAFAQTNATYELNIESQPLKEALKTFARQSGLQVVFFTEIAIGYTAPAIKGKLTRDEALRALLRDTSLTFREVNSNTVEVSTGGPRTTSNRPQRSDIRLAHVEAPSSEPSVSKSAVAGQDKEESSEIIVTGSHIRGASPVGSNLIVIDREEIVRSGYGRVQDFLEFMPQNYSGSAGEDANNDFGATNSTRGQAIDLRGLGASSTLVLINGRRQPMGGLEGSFVDISSIALSAVERIEVLTDGASALYGSDAIGGVVNFVLRKDYEGLETNVRGAVTTRGQTKEFRVSQLLGRNWSSGNALLGYQYSQRDALMRADLPYGSLNRDYRGFGGSDMRTLGGSPGVILTPAGQPAFAIPAGQNGTSLTAAQLIPGQANYQDNVTGIASVPEQAVHSGFLSLAQNIGDRLELFAEGRFGWRDMTLPLSDPTSTLTVPTTNAFYPVGSTGPLRVRYSFGKDLGGVTTQMSTTETYSATLGGNVRLGRQWELTTSAGYGREENKWKWLNNLIFGDQTVLTALASSNRATALNVFGDGSGNNPSTLLAINQTALGEGTSTIGSVAAVANGPILRFPGGMAKLAVGMDYRDERLRTSTASLKPATGVVTPYTAFSGVTGLAVVGNPQREVTAAFGEVMLPFVGDGNAMVGIRKLEISLAARYEDYSDFGSTLNPKFGLNITPVDGVVLRGSWGTSFRAPRFNEINTVIAPDEMGTARVVDPRSTTGFSDILYTIGGNPQLHEETADIWTAGFDLTPQRLSGLSLSATFFNLDYKDKIQRGGAGVTGTLTQESIWSAVIQRSPTPVQIAAICNSTGFTGTCPALPAAIIDLRIRNMAELRTQGIDVNAKYRTALRMGSLGFGLAGTYLLDYERAVTETAPPVNGLDTVANPLKLRVRGTVGWDFDRWQGAAAVNYGGGYRDVGNSRRVASWTTLDAGASYRLGGNPWTEGMRLRLSVLNVLDEKPPFVNQASGFDPVNANEMGRSVALEISRNW